MEKKIGVNQDEFGRYNGALLVKKPSGVTSHDIVDIARKKYSTRKVGHAGTLDPFAEGLMIVLIGKSTKLSDQFLGLDKVYEAGLLLGVSTDTHDIEGEITAESDVDKIANDQIEKAIQSFLPGYEQQVPIYSSVKVQGNKLRELARSNDRFEIDINKKKVRFYKEDKLKKELDLPFKSIKIFSIKILEIKNNIDVELQGTNLKNKTLVNIEVHCSKGTYIRQLANDIGEEIGTPAMLMTLKRNRIGEYKVQDAVSITN